MADTQQALTGSLLGRYRRIWRQAWQHRRRMDAPRRLAHEVQFLPAALELQDKPVHPAPRILMWTIIAFSVVALTWACFGKIDVVATATGKVIPTGKTKVIQSSETAVVKAIYVHDGQQVTAGQVLVELDPTTAVAEVGRLSADLVAGQIDAARASAMLKSIEVGKQQAIDGEFAAELPVEQRIKVERWLTGQYEEYRSDLALADAEIAQRSAEIQAAKASVASLEKALPIAENLAKDYERLLKQQYIARHAYLEKEQAFLDVERQLSVQRSSVVQLSAALREGEGRRQNVVAQARKAMLDLLQQSELRVQGQIQDLHKAQYQERIKILRSPVDGAIQQLAIHTNGGVVTPAQELMVVVPGGQPVEIEAFIQNKDIGFVKQGQEVEIKIDTFSFTKFGVVHGVVESISGDAVQDEKQGLVYPARIALEEHEININGQSVSISPGMAVQVEVKTDKRRIINYFLSPLEQYKHDSLRER